ncbi:HNH endonuclease [Nocardia nova]|uniref:HNH endonuclease n=1 Tax=Nocardia nova TaxID=37330 RepID=UPI0034E889A4
MREYRQANSDYFRNYGKRYHQAHREELLERMREYRRANPERRRQYKANRRQRISRQMTNEDRRESIEWRKTIKNDPCFYCGEFADQMHDDHMTPLARGGTDHWWNLVRSCATCNLRKNAKTAEEFIEEMTSNERSH